MEKLSKKEKALIGISIISTGVAVYFGLKYWDAKKLISDNDNKIYRLNHRIGVLEDVVSEDVLEEAIATTTRKLNYRIDKMEVYKDRTDDIGISKYEEHLAFANLFKARLNNFNKLKMERCITE